MDSDATDSMPTSAKLASWPFPPTPDSTLVPLPAPALPSTPFELLPPPLQDSPPHAQRPHLAQSGSSLARLLNEADMGVGRATPASLVGGGTGGAAALGGGMPPPSREAVGGGRRKSVEGGEGPQAGYFALKGKVGISVVGPRPILPKAQKLPTPPDLDEDDEFELDEIDEDDSADDDFAPSAAAATSKRPRRASTQVNSSGSNQSAHHASSVSPQLTATGGKPSNRKVSHSLIERRRREKINDCLATLRAIVPQCREQGEAKVARAKERGRKRGRKDDGEGEKQGLHKLEILQGTIVYIEQLEAQLASLSSDATLSPALPGAYSPAGSVPSSPATVALSRPAAHRPSAVSFSSVSSIASLSPVNGVTLSATKVALPPQPKASATHTGWPTIAELARRASISAPVPDDAAAELLLGLTSPELRPIRG